MQHGRGHRVGAECEAADRLKVPIRNERTHHTPDDGSDRPIERDPSQIDVVVGRTPRGQGDLAAYDRQRLDLLNQLGGVLGKSRAAHDRHPIIWRSLAHGRRNPVRSSLPVNQKEIPLPPSRPASPLPLLPGHLRSVRMRCPKPTERLAEWKRSGQVVKVISGWVGLSSGLPGTGSITHVSVSFTVSCLGDSSRT